MKGKVAVVTASSTGIGKAIAERLAQEGAAVVISSREKKHVDEVVAEFEKKGFEVIGVVCDVGKKADREKLIKQTVQKYGKLNYLVNNAAISSEMGKFLTAREEKIQEMWDINYKAAFFLVQEALPYLRAEKDSSIVIISSYTAYDLPPIIGHYAITKTALVALTKILAKELMDDGIRVNCVCPGLIKTNFSRPLYARGETKAEKMMGVKRLGVPSDISGVVRFLLSQESSYMTGESLVVAGR